MRLSDVIGQDRAVDALRRALRSGRRASAYLLTGPEGVGKRTLAVALASALNCLDAADEGCDSCLSCDKIEAGQHPDLLLIAPEGRFIKVDQVRQLQGHLAYAPHEGRARVVIIDGAEALNPNAANALLKSVEEPRPHTLFVLVSAAPHHVIPTLRSRCQRIRLHPLERDQVAQVVSRQCADQDEDVPAEAQQAAVAVAEGSPGRAMRLLGSEQLSAAREIMSSIITAARDGRGTTLFGASEQAGRERGPILEAFELLRIWLRDLLLLLADQPPEKLINLDQLELLRAEANRVDSRTVLRWLRAVQQAQTALAGYANPRLTLEALVLGLR